MGLTLHVYSPEGKDYYDEVLELLQEKFKSQEDMESRLDVYCLEVAQELRGTFIHTNDDKLVFNFTLCNKIL